MKKIFSVPFNVSLTEEKFSDFKVFLKKYNDLIFDVYFTFALPPFNEDAVGGISESKSTKGSINGNIDTIMSIQNECSVRVSATFNNIYVSPDINNLNLFIKNFATLYEKGVRSATLPFSSWVFSKEIRKNFPDLFIKNTVIWKVHSAREFWNLAETGFDYINLDRTLLRNQKTLWEIHEARESFYDKTGKRILLSILANESPCSGYCTFREEHQALLSHNQIGVEYFPSYVNVCLYSHMKNLNKNGLKMNFLKMAFISPFEEDFSKIGKVIDVFKLFGRIQPTFFRESLIEIENYANGIGFLTKIKNILLDYGQNNFQENLVKAWRKEIINCNFNCWKCSLCDKIYENLSEKNRKALVEHKIY